MKRFVDWWFENEHLSKLPEEDEAMVKRIYESVVSEVIDFVKPQRNDVPATGEEFAKRIQHEFLAEQSQLKQIIPEEPHKVYDRKQMMAHLAKNWPKLFLKTTEEFGCGEGGIWTSGEDGIEFDPKHEMPMPIFNYYNEVPLYEDGVIKEFANMLFAHGWFCEWYDPGTVMIYPS